MFTGQTIIAISQIFILGIPPQLAATWFPADQVSSACAIGVFGNQVILVLSYSMFLANQYCIYSWISALLQLGVALGFVVPVMLVSNQDDSANHYKIGDDLFTMFLGVAIITSVLLVVIIIGNKLGCTNK